MKRDELVKVLFEDTILEYEKTLKEITLAQEALILLVDSEEKSLNCITKETKIPISAASKAESILFECYYTKNPLLITHAIVSFLYRDAIDNLLNEKLNNILVVPILDTNSQNLIGIIWLATKYENKISFTKKDIEYVSRFSTVVCPSILTHMQKQMRPKDEHLFTILIVEDSLVIARFLEIILRRRSLHTVIAQSAISGIEKFLNNKIDLIFMDEIMAGIQGHQAIEKIRAIEKKQRMKPIPILGITSDNSSEVKQQFLTSGANLVMHKPLNPSDIVKAIEKFRELTNKQDC